MWNGKFRATELVSLPSFTVNTVVLFFVLPCMVFATLLRLMKLISQIRSEVSPIHSYMNFWYMIRTINKQARSTNGTFQGAIVQYKQVRQILEITLKSLNGFHIMVGGKERAILVRRERIFDNRRKRSKFRFSGRHYNYVTLAVQNWIP